MKKQITSLLALVITALGIGLTSSTANAATEIPISGVLTVKYNGRGGVNLLDSNGKYQNQYVKRNSKWKVFAKANINGRLMYRIGNQHQWIPATYASIGTSTPAAKPATKSVAKNTTRTSTGHGNNTVLVGNKRTKVYHLAGQEAYKISPANRIYFHSVAEAQAAGYRQSRR